MNILGRFILIIISSLLIPVIVIFYSNDIKKMIESENLDNIENFIDLIKCFNKLSIGSKMNILLYSLFVANWFLIIPSMIFMNCFKYIFAK